MRMRLRSSVERMRMALTEKRDILGVMLMVGNGVVEGTEMGVSTSILEARVAKLHLDCLRSDEARRLGREYRDLISVTLTVDPLIQGTVTSVRYSGLTFGSRQTPRSVTASPQSSMVNF